MQGGKFSRFLVLSNEISGLWSVSRRKNLPGKYIENRLQAHVRASASFSICA